VIFLYSSSFLICALQTLFYTKKFISDARLLGAHTGKWRFETNIPQWGSCNLLKLPAKGNEAKLELAAKLFQKTKIKINSSSNELRQAGKI
jgi:hypothetical protein